MPTLIERLRLQNFRDNDSKIASSIMHPITALELLARMVERRRQYSNDMLMSESPLRTLDEMGYPVETLDWD